MRWFLFCFLLGSALMVHGAASRDDWRVFPMTESNVEIPLDLFYTKQEFVSITQGFIPRDMGDRWVVVVEEEHIFFYRCWTGTMIYDCSFEEKEDGIWIYSMYANRNIEEYINTDDQHDVEVVESFLNWLAEK